MDDGRKAASGFGMLVWVWAARAGLSVASTVSSILLMRRATGWSAYAPLSSRHSSFALEGILHGGVQLLGIGVTVLLVVALARALAVPSVARARGLLKLALAGFLAGEVLGLSESLLSPLLVGRGYSITAVYGLTGGIGQAIDYATWATFLAALYQSGRLAGRAAAGLFGAIVALAAINEALPYASGRILSLFGPDAFLYYRLALLPTRLAEYGLLIAYSLGLARAAEERAAPPSLIPAPYAPSLPGA